MILRSALSDLCRTVVQETTTSFIFGTAAAATKELLRTDKNMIAKNLSVLRRGVEHAEHTLLYNTLFFVANAMRIRKSIAHAMCLMMCSFISGRRNGLLFAVKGALFSLFSGVLSSALL